MPVSSDYRSRAKLMREVEVLEDRLASEYSGPLMGRIESIELEARQQIDIIINETEAMTGRSLITRPRARRIRPRPNRAEAELYNELASGRQIGKTDLVEQIREARDTLRDPGFPHGLRTDERLKTQLRTICRDLGRYVADYYHFTSGNDFIDWARPYIIEGGRCGGEINDG